jgi:hypothetical protein
MAYAYVDIAQIDQSDMVFRLDDAKLDDAVRRQPLFPYNPIWLQRKKSDQYRIVDGFRVVSLLAADREPSRVTAYIFAVDDPLLDLWNLRIHKRITENNLITVNYLHSLAGLLETLSLETVSYDQCPSLTAFSVDLPLKRSRLDQILAKAKRFGLFTDLARLTYFEMKALAAFSDADLDSLAQWLSGLALKGNKLSTLLQLVTDLQRGFGLTVSDLAVDPEIVAIRRTKPLPSQYRFLKQRLTDLRYPELTRQRQEWATALRQLSGPFARIGIHCDPDFEADDIRFTVSSRSPSDLKTRLQELLEATNSRQVAALFDFV